MRTPAAWSRIHGMRACAIGCPSGASPGALQNTRNTAETPYMHKEKNARNTAEPPYKDHPKHLRTQRTRSRPTAIPDLVITVTAALWSQIRC